MSLRRWLRHLLLPDWAVNRVLPAAALARIEAAIGQTERRHRGQIRFAIEATLHPLQLARGVTARERAIEVFSALRVWDTEENNGVLLYLLLADHDVEIVADRGIDRRAGGDAWGAVCSAVEAGLRAGRTEAALIDGIERIAGILQAHYPAAGPGRNELPDAPALLR